ncbi:MAG: hypothetical protein IV100_07245 [Myxococcales bacterium]|nr:hypothetical protein [Myxococcales bacterium]
MPCGLSRWSREAEANVEGSKLDTNNCANSAGLIIETSMHREGPWTLAIGPVCRDNMTTAVKLNIEGRYAVALLGRALANRGGCGTMAWVLPDGGAVGVGSVDSGGDCYG